jgi:hypothetical protein
MASILPAMAAANSSTLPGTALALAIHPRMTLVIAQLFRNGKAIDVSGL